MVRIQVHFRTAILHIVYRQGAVLGDHQHLQEIVGRCGQRDLQGLVVQGLYTDLGEVRELAGVVGLGILDHIEHVGILRGGCGVQHLFPGVYELIGGDGAAVRPGGIPQGEGVDLAVLGDVPLFGQAGAGQNLSLGVLADQALVHAAQQLISLGGGGSQGT